MSGEYVGKRDSEMTYRLCIFERHGNKPSPQFSPCDGMKRILLHLVYSSVDLESSVKNVRSTPFLLHGSSSSSRQPVQTPAMSHNSNRNPPPHLLGPFNALRSRHFLAPPQPHTSTPNPLSRAAALASRTNPARSLRHRAGCSGGAANPGRAGGWVARLAGWAGSKGAWRPH